MDRGAHTHPSIPVPPNLWLLESVPAGKCHLDWSQSLETHTQTLNSYLKVPLTTNAPKLHPLPQDSAENRSI